MTDALENRLIDAERMYENNRANTIAHGSGMEVVAFVSEISAIVQNQPAIYHIAYIGGALLIGYYIYHNIKNARVEFEEEQVRITKPINSV